MKISNLVVTGEVGGFTYATIDIEKWWGKKETRRIYVLNLSSGRNPWRYLADGRYVGGPIYELYMAAAARKVMDESI